MTFHVFITTPRAGMGFAIAPYTVEAKQVFATRALAQAFADAKTLSAGVTALFDAMPSAHPAWKAGTIAAGVLYAAGTYRSHAGKTWRAAMTFTDYGDPNWAPGGAANLWVVVGNPGKTAWQAGIDVTVGQELTYDGRLYRVVIGHRTQADWTPPVTPALFANLGPADSVPAYTRAIWAVVSSTDPDYTQVVRAKEA